MAIEFNISNLAKSVGKFLPEFESSKIEADIDNLSRELNKELLPVYKTFLDPSVGLNKRDSFKSRLNQAYDAKLLSIRGVNYRCPDFKSKPPANGLCFIYEVLGLLDGHLSHLYDLSYKNFKGDVASQHLTYLQVNLIRLIEFSDFMLRYSRRLLIYYLQNEEDQLLGTDSGSKRDLNAMEGLPKGDIRWLEMNFTLYCQILKVFAVDRDNFIKSLKSIPDIEITTDKEASEMASNVYGSNQLDPMGVGFISPALSPIYYIRKFYVEWRFKRIEGAKTERSLVELRLKRYQLMKETGQGNANLDETIRRTAERLSGLNQKIAKMEDDFNRDYNA